MELAPYQKRILELHLELELLMADLYELFAGQFKEQSAFWLSLADEEKQHAAWLNKLQEGINANKVKFDEGKTRTYTLTSVIGYLRNIKEEFRTRPFGIVRAVILIRDFENSLLEKNVFLCFAGDSPLVKEILTKMATAQRTHTKKMVEGAAKILKESSITR